MGKTRDEFLKTQVNNYRRFTALNGLLIQLFGDKVWRCLQEAKADLRKAARRAQPSRAEGWIGWALDPPRSLEILGSRCHGSEFTQEQ